MAGRFLIAFDALALRATACALSVTAYAVLPLPKGEARALPETLHFSWKLYRYHRSLPPVGGRWRVAPDEGAD